MTKSIFKREESVTKLWNVWANIMKKQFFPSLYEYFQNFTSQFTFHWKKIFLKIHVCHGTRINSMTRTKGTIQKYIRHSNTLHTFFFFKKRVNIQTWWTHAKTILDLLYDVRSNGFNTHIKRERERETQTQMRKKGNERSLVHLKWYFIYYAICRPFAVVSYFSNEKEEEGDE